MMKYVRFLIGGCVLAGGLLLAVGTLNAGEPLMLRPPEQALSITVELLQDPADRKSVV